MQTLQIGPPAEQGPGGGESVKALLKGGANQGFRPMRTGAVKRKTKETDVEVAVDLDGLKLLDDQHAGHTAAGLLQAVGMRMVPEGAGIGRRELVGKAPTRLDGRLRQAWHAVHGIRQPYAVPVNGGGLVENIFDKNTDRPALL